MSARVSTTHKLLAAFATLSLALVWTTRRTEPADAADPPVVCVELPPVPGEPVARPALDGSAGPTRLEPAPDRTLCTHGPDQADAQQPALRTAAAEPPSASLGAAATPDIECYGDGSSGQRVQAIYARAADRPDRSATVIPEIMGYAAQVDAEVAASAAETGGERHVRWVTSGPSPGCTLEVQSVVLSASGDDDFAQRTVPEIRQLGFNRLDRAYVLWMDADLYCGIGSLYTDTTPGAANRNFAGPSWSRIDVPCWGRAETHELGHNLGAVQNDAPNSNLAGHCRDEYDLMCYSDPQGAPLYVQPYRCPDEATANRRLDCGHDDYFHTNPPPGSYLASAWNSADSPFLARTASVSTEALGSYHPVTPGRVYDGRWPGRGRITPGTVAYAKLIGAHGIPPTGVAAVAVNLTVTEPVAPGYLTAYSLDAAGRPTVSNLNYVAGQTVANSAVVTVPFDGWVQLFSNGGHPYVVVDVAGWYADGAGYSSERGSYHPLTPARVLDTRQGLGGNRLGPQARLDLQLAGQGGVPASGAASVVLNLTGVAPSETTYLTAWPSGEARPTASNLNLGPNAVVPNQVVAKLGADGRISIYNAAGFIDVVADVAGWFDDGGPGAQAGGAVYHPLAPARVLDTRQPGQGPALGAGDTRRLDLAGRGGVPPTGAVAVAANLTVTEPTVGGHLTVWPSGTPMPTASVLNYVAGQTVANLSLVSTPAGSADVANAAGQAHLVVDVAGWYGSDG